MKSNNVLERKYELKKGMNDKDLCSRINSTFCDIFKYYDKLDDNGIESLREYIDNFFAKLRPTKYKDEKYRNELKGLLYPDIYFVGLAHLYSNDGYTQYSFLLKIKAEMQNKCNKNKEKIK